MFVKRRKRGALLNSEQQNSPQKFGILGSRNLIISRRSQLTVFIVIAIVIVALVAGYFLLRGKITIGKIPARFRTVQQYFLSCIEENARIGVEILGGQGGYIYAPEFFPGSEYAPTSSQLSFFGSPVPYWYYISGNNIIREQIPSKQGMEAQLEKFVQERVLLCDFSEFERRGFFIGVEEPKANVDIQDEKVKVNLDMLLTISDGEETWQTRNLNVEVSTKLGRFYNLAREIYDKEKEEAFLEEYAVDILRLYAPVDGVELSCSPKIWSKVEIDNELKSAIEANTGQLKVKGEYYDLKDKSKEYFVVKDIKSAEAVNFLYSPQWPTRIEVEPEEQGLLIAEPVGLEPGLGVLGFCYVPYHFVYDLVYPVLIQIYDSNEMFQFPVSVMIDKNKPREALRATSLGEQEVELCEYRNQDVSVYTYDTNLKPVEADISFKCFTQECDIGKSVVKGGDAILQGKFPQCVNGFILAKAEGYETAKQQISTNRESVANIILDRLYKQSLVLKVGGKETSYQTIIYFESDVPEKSKTIVWPQVNSVELSEGFYNISVYVYTNESIKIPAGSTEKCMKVPKSGLFGIVGMTEEKCFDIDIPEQTLTAGIVGGGKINYYAVENELKRGRLEINAEKFPTPTSLEQLQDNYNLLDVKSVNLKFG